MPAAHAVGRRETILSQLARRQTRAMDGCLLLKPSRQVSDGRAGAVANKTSVGRAMLYGLLRDTTNDTVSDGQRFDKARVEWCGWLNDPGTTADYTDGYDSVCPPDKLSAQRLYSGCDSSPPDNAVTELNRLPRNHCIMHAVR